MSKSAQPGFLHRFLAHATRSPDDVALVVHDAGARLSYGELRAEAERVAGALLRAGVGAGDEVVVLLPTHVAFVTTYLALVSLGAVPVLVGEKQTSFELEPILRHAEPSFVVTTAAHARQHRALFASSKSVRSVLTVDGVAESVAAFGTPLATSDAAPVPLAAPAGNPVVTVQYTWKGLGRPLAVRHRYLSLTQSTDGLHERFLPQGPGDVHLVALPLSAVFGLTVLFLFPLSVGATMLIVPNAGRVELLGILEEARVTFASVVPDLLRVLVGQCRAREGGPAPSLDGRLTVLSGGSYLTPELADEARQCLGRPVIQGYGLTETLPVTVESVREAPRPGSIGRAITGVELRVVGPDGEDAAPGVTGEVLLRGPTVPDEYVRDPEATALHCDGGWFRTGDLATKDEDGHVFFVGRRLPITKVAGQMVDLVEIEAVACTLPGVLAARAHVVREPLGRASVRLTLRTEAGATLTDAEVTTALRARLSPHKVPRAVRIVPVAPAVRCAS